MAISAIAAIGSLLAGGAAVASAAGAQNRQPQQSALAMRQLQDAEANTRYQQALNALATRRSTAGYQDSFGSSLQYDPATNTWISTEGQLPQTADLSALLNTIARNTTDAGQQRFANARASQRATLAEPGADRAIRDFNIYQPVNANEITGALTTQAANANSDAYRNVLADTLRQFSRTGTAAAPVIASIGSKSANDLRSSLVDARLKGMGAADEINRSRIGTLGSTAATASGLASPQFQAAPFQASNRGDILTQLEAQQSRTAAIAPVYGGENVNRALGGEQTATNAAISNVPNPNFGLNKIGELGSTIGNLTDPKGKFMTGLETLFGSGTTKTDYSGATGGGLTSFTNPQLDFYNKYFG